MGFLKKYWKAGRLLFFSAVICVALEAFCDLLQPRMMSYLIDEGVMKTDQAAVGHYALLMLLITAMGALFATVRNVAASVVSQRFAADLRKDLLEKIQRLPIAISEQYDSGSLITRLTNDVSQLSNTVNGMMRIFFKAPVICVGSIILATTMNIRTLPIVLVVVVLTGLSIFLSMKLSYPLFAQVQKAIDKMNTTVQEYLMGIRLVRAFGRYGFERDRFGAANDKLADTTYSANRILAFFSPVTNLLSNCGIAAILLIGSHWVKTGDMQIGQVVAFISYMTQILFSLSIISNLLNMFVRTKASYVRIADIMNRTESEMSSEQPCEPARFEKAEGLAIRFQQVSFRYPDTTGELALQEIAFTLPPQKMLGIIGPTGSGKSSLASLLLRFYEPTDGQIFINSTDLKTLTPFAVRQRVALVPQQPSLFSGTIAENIAWAKPDATEEEIRQAAQIAGAYDFIRETPNGFQTPLGQRGVNLSGGQKQRISIARALCAKPDILILDDATSALDTLTERNVLQQIKEHARGLSCMVISQRVSTVMRADCILVLDNGAQAGFGQHADLMSGCQAYQDIYASQMGGGGK